MYRHMHCRFLGLIGYELDAIVGETMLELVPFQVLSVYRLVVFECIERTRHWSSTIYGIIGGSYIEMYPKYRLYWCASTSCQHVTIPASELSLHCRYVCPTA